MIEPIKDLWHLHIDDRSLEMKGMVGWLEFEIGLVLPNCYWRCSVL
ncbi:hypothetical protein CKAH01_19073 [Colletotrichum kahawae]|uniref:Uncharacterized protein n=1 Tax=Colletotrichum kahawae TaxID=34407 RepID=A0AAD9Y181_COLKA|nr:hypothetical protein CKAH01_19073 [Colletotrichum kahawae]